MVVIRQEKQKEEESSGVGRLLLLTAAVIIYLFIGMGIFYKIEHPIEQEAHRKRIPLRKIIESFQELHPSVNETELQKLLLNVLRMNGDGKLQWTGADPPHWTYPRAIYFAVSVITTIGFGNVILKTNMGRVCAVLYAVVGIPLTVLLYVEIGRFLSEQMCELVLRLYALCHPQHEELSGKSATIISTVFIFTIGTISFIFLPSLVIQILEEGWTYLEACYFAFTTIATIGFGDYVAGADEVMPSKFMHWYRAALTVWIFLGLGWLSTLLNVIGRLARYLMDKGEEMINHEYDQLVDKDHFEHCHHCRHKRHSKGKHHGKKRRRSKPSTPELEENNHD